MVADAGAKTPAAISLVAGGVAGGVEAACTYPFEFAKTRVQLYGHEGVRNPFYVVAKVAREEGARALYKGCSTMIVVCAKTLSTSTPTPTSVLLPSMYLQRTELVSSAVFVSLLPVREHAMRGGCGEMAPRTSYSRNPIPSPITRKKLVEAVPATGSPSTLPVHAPIRPDRNKCGIRVSCAARMPTYNISSGSIASPTRLSSSGRGLSYLCSMICQWPHAYFKSFFSLTVTLRGRGRRRRGAGVHFWI